MKSSGSNCSRRRKARAGGWPESKPGPTGAGPWLGGWQPMLWGHPCWKLQSPLLVTSRASLSRSVWFPERDCSRAHEWLVQCPLGAAGARGTATTDGYQLFHKESCSDLNQRQLRLCGKVSVKCCMSVVFYWVLEMCVCVCAQAKQFRGVARSYSVTATPTLNIGRNPHMDQEAVMLRANLEMHLGHIPLFT